MVILEFISSALLIVYVITEKRYLPTVNFEILFAVLGIAIAVLSYLYNSIASLAVSSIVVLLVLIKIMKMVNLVNPRPEGDEKRKRE